MKMLNLSLIKIDSKVQPDEICHVTYIMNLLVETSSGFSPASLSIERSTPLLGSVCV